MKIKKRILQASLMVLVLTLLTTCSNPNTSASDLDPINPDPNPGTYTVDIDYTVYANIENQIRRFTTSDPSDYTVIATGVDPDVSEFFITDDNEYLVYVKSTNAIGESGHYLIVRKIGTDIDTYVPLANPSRDLRNEFVLGGYDVIFSDNATLRSYNISSKMVSDLNNDENHVCNHFPALFGDKITFIDQIRNTSGGSIHIIENDTQNPDNVPIYGSYQGYVPFGTYLYPTILDGTQELLFMQTDTYCDSFVYVPDYLNPLPTTVKITNQSVSDVNFNKVFQTPAGSKVLLYGYTDVFWFANDGTIAPGSNEVSVKKFYDTINQIIATPDEAYYILSTEYGMWLYDADLTQLLFQVEWLNQADRVLWMEIKQSM